MDAGDSGRREGGKEGERSGIIKGRGGANKSRKKEKKRVHGETREYRGSQE